MPAMGRSGAKLNPPYLQSYHEMGVLSANQVSATDLVGKEVNAWVESNAACTSSNLAVKLRTHGTGRFYNRESKARVCVAAAPAVGSMTLKVAHTTSTLFGVDYSATLKADAALCPVTKYAISMRRGGESATFCTQMLDVNKARSSMPGFKAGICLIPALLTAASVLALSETGAKTFPARRRPSGLIWS